jgi:hypothetical protein
VPDAVGSKNTPIEQLEPTATLLPQALSGPKSAGLVATFVIVSGPLPVFVNVTLCGKPEVPTYWLGKVKLGGDNARTGPLPVPVNAMVWGLPGALSVTTTEALSLPNVVGVKVTLMAQLPFGGMVVGQLFIWAKTLLFVPVMTIDAIVTLTVPRFVRVDMRAGLVIPTV